MRGTVFLRLRVCVDPFIKSSYDALFDTYNIIYKTYKVWNIIFLNESTTYLKNKDTATQRHARLQGPLLQPPAPAEPTSKYFSHFFVLNFIFSFLLNLLGWHWLTKLYVSGAQFYNTSSVHGIVCSPPKWGLLPSPFSPLPSSTLPYPSTHLHSQFWI